MSNKLLVRGKILTFQGKQYRCAIGKNGFAADKKEGDSKTPIGTFALRECWYRADRLGKPETQLPLRIITQADGWCDDPRSAEYNRHILLPSPLEGEGWVGGGSTSPASGATPHLNPPPQGGRKFSHENLFREERVYDLIIPLGYNDNPITPGKGSAIFMHVAKPDYAGTEGCIALAQQDLLDILPFLSITTQIEITEN